MRRSEKQSDEPISFWELRRESHLTLHPQVKARCSPRPGRRLALPWLCTWTVGCAAATFGEKASLNRPSAQAVAGASLSPLADLAPVVAIEKQR